MVLTAIRAMRSVIPERDEPALKPNQPKARMNVPTITMGM